MSASDYTTDAVAEAREMIREFASISCGRTRYGGQPERADERYDRNRRALVARIDDLEAKLAAVTRERDELWDRILTVAKGSWIGTNPTQSKEEILAAMERVREHWGFAAVDRDAPRKRAENAELSAKYDRIEMPQTGDVTGRDV